MTQNKFPTEIIDLPPRYFYPKDNPLSSGKIEMRYMTLRDEDILTSSKLNSTRRSIDKLLESLIVDKTIDYNDILVGDKISLVGKSFTMVKTMIFFCWWVWRNVKGTRFKN